MTSAIIVSESTAIDRDRATTATLQTVTWGAVLAGVVVALVAQLLLAILGLGVGLATVDPASNGSPSATTLSIGAGVWWVLSGIIASALGGFVAGQLSGRALKKTAAYHALVSWAVTTLVVVFLLSSAVGGMIGGAFGAVTGALGGAGHLVGGAVQTAAQAAGPALPGMGDALSGIESQVRSASGGQDPAQLRDIAAQAVKAAVTGDASQQQQAIDRAADALARAQNIPVDQAKAQVQSYRQQYTEALTQAKAKATQAADVAAKASSRAALLIVVSLVLGAVAAAAGGIAGRARTTIGPREL